MTLIQLIQQLYNSARFGTPEEAAEIFKRIESLLPSGE